MVSPYHHDMHQRLGILVRMRSLILKRMETVCMPRFIFSAKLSALNASVIPIHACQLDFSNQMPIFSV